jgi:hypothetical protein
VEKIGIYAMAALWLSLSALLFAPQAAAADGLEWFYDDSGRAGETKWIDTATDADGIETFGFVWKMSDDILSFSSIPGGLRIIIR